MRAGIRGQFPNHNEEQVTAKLWSRLKIRRELDQRGIYEDAGELED